MWESFLRNQPDAIFSGTLRILCLVHEYTSYCALFAAKFIIDKNEKQSTKTSKLNEQTIHTKI
jgi:hypothetical protein